MQKLSVIVPVFNEKETVEEIIKRIEFADTLGLEKEIIIVDDGSTDGTRDILKKFIGKHKIFLKEKNRGKGHSLRLGFGEASGDILVIQDADLEYNPCEYKNLLRPIVNGMADVVYGSRFMGDGPHRVLYFWHYLGNKFLTTLSNMLTNLNLTDMETCFKMFRREIIDEVAPSLVSDKFGFEPEITAKVGKLARENRCRIFEVGVSYNGRTYEEGKKIGWKDGLEAIFCIIKFNIFSDQ